MQIMVASPIIWSLYGPSACRDSRIATRNFLRIHTFAKCFGMRAAPAIKLSDSDQVVLERWSRDVRHRLD